MISHNISTCNSNVLPVAKHIIVLDDRQRHLLASYPNVLVIEIEGYVRGIVVIQYAFETTVVFDRNGICLYSNDTLPARVPEKYR